MGTSCKAICHDGLNLHLLHQPLHQATCEHVDHLHYHYIPTLLHRYYMADQYKHNQSALHILATKPSELQGYPHEQSYCHYEFPRYQMDYLPDTHICAPKHGKVLPYDS